MALILIIDDEEAIITTLGQRLERLEHQVKSASNIDSGMELLDKFEFDLVFLDVNLPDGNGLDLLGDIKEKPSKPDVVIMTGTGCSKGAQMAIKGGAWDYITKPFQGHEINLLVKRALDYRALAKASIKIVAVDKGPIVGESRKIKECINSIASCAENKANVLILGETGTGKELFARAVHDNSHSVKGDYIVVDCAALPESLTPSLLFGHVKGAFTGADKDCEGLVKQADNGTLFLDEIGELPLNVQKSFLRVLQEKKFRPVGSSKEKKSDFRLISATNRNLEQMVKQGKFREDLFHRIKTITINLPSLKERKDDIRILTLHYIDRICKKYSLKTKALLPETLEILESYEWPGNVRELVNSIEKAILSQSELPILYPMFLPDTIRISYAKKRMETKSSKGIELKSDKPSSETFLTSLYDGSEIIKFKDFKVKFNEKIETLYLKSILGTTGWDIDRAVKISGISKSRVYHYIKKYNIKNYSK
ncbi:MAG: sigma-54 dependent transcriptional regulator [Desulforegulaceae bacterium]|nr:sigma-54 dependent transcriptional regulator [Desulforegulaceae bacterium]